MNEVLILISGILIGIFIAFYCAIEVSVVKENRHITCLHLGVEQEKCKQIFDGVVNE